MTPPPALQDDFVAFAGEVAESLSFNRSIGQLYGLLYISPEPLSLGEISRRLAMSKGNASINLRTLESWGAVRPVAVNGSRQDHYQANYNLREVAMNRLREGLGRRVALAEENLNRILADRDGGADPALKKRLQELKGLVGSAQKALKALPTLLKFLPK